MSTGKPDMPDQSSIQGSDALELPPAATGKQRKRKRWASVLRTLGLISLVFLVLGAVGVGGAEHYTAQPNFCGSCHIMEPYYQSWSHDLHGAKLDVRCVDCHYAPGEQHTVMAKFRGLSQAASYFSGRSGKSRPRAHVADASCLTSKCHGDEEYLSTTLVIGEPRVETRFIGDQAVQIDRQPTVRFVHAKHLRVDERLAEAIETQQGLAGRLKANLSPGDFDRIKQVAVSVEPAAQRQSKMLDLLKEVSGEGEKADALEFMRLEHARVRLEQLKGITCAACHTFDATGENHFKVNQQVCFTCHFMNQSFNRETGECLKCHEPPSRMIAVHSLTTTTTTTRPTVTTKDASAMMDHRDIVERKIDCASCHLDVIQRGPAVSERECGHCHDQERYLRGFATRSTETVEDYHRIHVAAQHARCTDCHRAIVHRLIEPSLVGTSEDFLLPVLNDCRHCHPNHHEEQVDLLAGVGGLGVARPMPNAMFGSRLNCRACHVQSGSDFKGDPLIKATESTCVACHSDDYRRLFEQWLSEIKNYIEEAESSLRRADERIDALKKAGKSIPEHVRQQVDLARHNIRLVSAGNGIHNKNYALQLLDLSIRDLDEAMVTLAKL